MDAGTRVPMVMLVEDDPGDVLMITEALERARVPSRVHVVGDGQEALDFLRRPDVHATARRPDLIMMDLNMPRMDGRQALTAIKADERLQAIPVVVLTTSDADTDVRASYQAHANAYVTTPIDWQTLETVVDQIIYFYTTVSTLPPAGH